MPNYASDPKTLIDRIKCFALDMDGTIYLSENWIDGARKFLGRIEQSGRSYVFLTNNSSKSALAYVDKLSRMGLHISRDQLITSGEATIQYLKSNFPGKKVFLLGNEVLTKEFAEEGIMLDDAHPDVVVTSFDTSLTYQKLCRVCDLVRDNLPYVATHPDYNCPTDTGFIPDIGAIHEFIHASTLRYPDEIIGKPHREIIQYMLKKTGANAEETAIVGDRMYTDIAAGVNNGLTSILVLSGETKKEDIESSGVKPDLILPSVKGLIPLL